MTEPLTSADHAYTEAKVRRRKARRVMQSVTLACLLAAAGVAAEQAYAGGLRAFLDRPAGVGATPPDPKATSPTVSATPLAR